MFQEVVGQQFSDTNEQFGKASSPFADRLHQFSIARDFLVTQIVNLFVCHCCSS